MNAYNSLIAHLKELGKLKSISALLGWDERTQLPPKGGEARADQTALMATMIHARLTDPRMAEWLSACEASDSMSDPESDFAVNVRETRRNYDRAVKLPADWVDEMARTEVLAQQAWVEARKKSSFPEFAPWLTKILDLKKRQADYLQAGDKGPFDKLMAGKGTGDKGGSEEKRQVRPAHFSGRDQLPNAYDALLDEFEPRETTANLHRVFESLRDPLIDLVSRIAHSPRKAPVEILQRQYPTEAQHQLATEASRMLGFDFSAGRLDVSVHPFSTGIAPGDTRITTRYDEHYFGDAFFGTLHETGHALYSQGLPAEHFGTPRGDDISLGIHESQSRLWENFVSRSRSFWKFFFPKVLDAFPNALRDVNEDQWHFAVNNVRPSLIRTEADELTYNLHVLLRFELEQSLVAGELPVRDVPEAWNQRMRKYFNLTPPDDARGCLQDIHWSGGAFGYFPTYTLGNLYAAQFFEQARKDIGDVDLQFSAGDFAPLLGWLRKNIHSRGQMYSASQLVQKVTGQPLSSEPLLRHLRRKAKELYGV